VERCRVVVKGKRGGKGMGPPQPHGRSQGAEDEAKRTKGRRGAKLRREGR
jgi:hypothetical protein